MPLRDLFGPRHEPEWKHPDAAVRAAAVRRLGEADLDVIQGLAREDPAPQVRRAALRRIRDSRTIAEIVAKETDESVRDEAFGLLVAAATSNADPDAAMAALGALVESRHLATVAKAAVLEPVRRAAVLRLADSKALAQVAREAQDPATRLAALDKIDDTAVVSSVAMGSEHKDVAVAATERVRNPETLKPIAARARSKAAARRARALLEALGQSPHEASREERRRRQSKVLETLESLARSHDWAFVARERAEAESAWHECQEDAEPSLAARVEAARRIVEARLAAHEKEIASAEAKRGARGEALRARTALCDQAEALAEDAAAASLDDLRAAWNALPAFEDPDVLALAHRFERSIGRARSRQEADAATAAIHPQADALCAEAETAAEDDDLREAFRALSSVEHRWSELHGARSAAPELAERLRRANARLRERQAQSKAERDKEAKDNAARLETLCTHLETLAAQESPNLREVDRALREGRDAESRLGPLPGRDQREAFLSRLRDTRQALYPKLQALRQDADWQQWANLSVQEELCRRVEALAARDDMEAVAQELRDIDVKWKQASSVGKDKGEALWQRFRAAREPLRSRCDEYFTARAAEHSANLKKKEELCVRAEALAQSTDWLKTAQAIQALQAEWKTVGPVARHKSKAIWDRFHTACDAFFKRRKEDRGQRRQEWAKNRERKEALCVRIEALAESTDWEATAAEVRKLQTEWKSVGPVDHKHSETLWQRFRGAANRFFERYGRRDEIAREGVAAALETLCTEMEALTPAEGASGPPPEDIAERLADLHAAWRQTGTIPEPAMAPLTARFANARTRVVKAYPEAFRGTDLDTEANKKKMEKLCARVEALANELAPQPAERTTERLVEQLRNALASNTIGGKEAVLERWKAAAEEIEAAQAAWRRIGFVQDADAQALAQRFEHACTRLLRERPRPPAAGRPRASSR